MKRIEEMPRHKQFLELNFTQDHQQTTLLEELINEIKILGNLDSLKEEIRKNFDIKEKEIINTKVEKVRFMYESLCIRTYFRVQSHEVKDKWYPFELKLFTWTISFYLTLKKKGVEDLTLEQWMKFSQQFHGKNLGLLQYQANFIKKSKQKQKKWSKEEHSIFYQQVENYQMEKRIKWNQISRQIYFQSEGRNFRTPQQCREYWKNYLNPLISKKPWSLEEDLLLLKSSIKFNKRWSTISKSVIKTRSDHSIKYRYSVLLKLYLSKDTNKYLEEQEVVHKIIKEFSDKKGKPSETQNQKERNKHFESEQFLSSHSLILSNSCFMEHLKNIIEEQDGDVMEKENIFENN